MEKKEISLVEYWIVISILCINVFTSLFGYIWLQNSQQRYHDEAGRNASNIVNTLENSLSTALRTVEIAMDSISMDIQECQLEYNNSCEKIPYILNMRGKHLPEAQGFFYATPEGMILHGYSSFKDISNNKADVTERDYFKQLKSNPEKRIALSKPQIGKITNRWAMQMAKPIQDNNNKIIGYVIASIDLERLQKLIETVNLGNFGAMSLRDENMAIILRVPEKNGIGSQSGVKNISKELQNILDTGKTSGTYLAVTPIDQIKRTVSFSKSSNYPLYINVGLSSNDYLVSWQHEKNIFIGSIIFMMSFSFFMSFILIRTYRKQRTEIENRKTVEKALKEENEKTTGLLINSSDAIFIWDSNKNLLEISDSLCHLIGYKREDIFLIDTKIWNLHNQNKKNGVEETKFRKNSGELLDVEISYHSIILGNKELTFFSARDVAERKRNEQKIVHYQQHLEEIVKERMYELSKARLEAERLSKVKSEFLSNMSHEIRTPLNGVLGLTHIGLKETKQDKKAQEIFTKIKRSGELLLGILNSILDLSKIESGKLQLEEIPINFSEIVQHMDDLMRELAEEKNIQLTIDPVPNVKVLGDQVRLQQAILNYLSNAIKFTSKGYVKLKISVTKTTEIYTEMLFEVEDTGIGIDQSKIKKMFLAFEQSDTTITRKFGGTGLGLAITKDLAVLMGGEYGARSIPNSGSLFWFTAKLKNQIESIIPETNILNIEEELMEYVGSHVLLVEDEPINREISKQLLEEIGLLVEDAHDGLEAIQKAKHGHFDLIIMDMQMPKMGGLEATRKIREWDTSTPIIAMTANAFEEDRKKCMEAGMSDFLGKPIEPEKVFKTILKWLKHNENKN